MAEPWVALERLTVRFGSRAALDGVDATLNGRCVGLLGPNGAGKTTLLQTLLGFHRPSAGVARVLGFDAGADARRVHRLIGYMPERDSFIAGMTGVRFTRLFAELSGMSRSEALDAAHDALARVGLGEARYRRIETYSQGMKQLVKLAQAIAHGPRLLLLDEPTNGLDPPTRERMLRLIQDVRDADSGPNGARLIVSSHLLRDVEACCDEALVLKAGRVATYCDLAGERRANRKFLTLQVHGDHEAFAVALSGLGCEVGLTSRRSVRAVLPADVEIADLYAIAQAQRAQIRRLDYKRDSLEDIFLRAMEAE